MCGKGFYHHMIALVKSDLEVWSIHMRDMPWITLVSYFYYCWPFFKIKMPGSFVIKLATRLNIIYPARRMVFSLWDRPKTQPEYHYQTARTGMQQQKLPFVIAMYWDLSLLMLPLVAKTIAFVIVAMKWMEKQKERLKKLRTGFVRC